MPNVKQKCGGGNKPCSPAFLDCAEEARNGADVRPVSTEPVNPDQYARSIEKFGRLCVFPEGSKIKYGWFRVMPNVQVVEQPRLPVKPAPVPAKKTQESRPAEIKKPPQVEKPPARVDKHQETPKPSVSSGDKMVENLGIGTLVLVGATLIIAALIKKFRSREVSAEVVPDLTGELVDEDADGAKPSATPPPPPPDLGAKPPSTPPPPPPNSAAKPPSTPPPTPPSSPPGSQSAGAGAASGSKGFKAPPPPRGRRGKDPNSQTTKWDPHAQNAAGPDPGNLLDDVRLDQVIPIAARMLKLPEFRGLSIKAVKEKAEEFLRAWLELPLDVRSVIVDNGADPNEPPDAWFSWQKKEEEEWKRAEGAAGADKQRIGPDAREIHRQLYTKGNNHFIAMSAADRYRLCRMAAVELMVAMTDPDFMKIYVKDGIISRDGIEELIRRGDITSTGLDSGLRGGWGLRADIRDIRKKSEMAKPKSVFRGPHGAPGK